VTGEEISCLRKPGTLPEQYATPVEQASAPDLTAQLHDLGILTDEEFASAMLAG